MSDDVRRTMARKESGFALVLVLLVLVGFTALSTAGWIVAHTDYRASENHGESVAAFYTADAGLREYLGRGKLSTTPTTYTYAGGSADVRARPLVEVDSANTLYLVTSRALGSELRGSRGSRTVRTVVLQAAAAFNVKAAFTAPPGLNKNGVAGSLSGIDGASSADCPTGGLHDVAGAAVPPGALNVAGGGPPGGGGGGGGGGGYPPGFHGDPPVDDSKSSQELLAETNIPWQGVLEGTAVGHDYVASVAYPNFSMEIGADEWPVVYLDSDSYQMNPPQSGRGMLIVKGDLIFNGNVEWDGLILAGGTITSNGQQTIEGAAIAGLNMLLGENVGASNLGNGTWEYQYHSCNVLKALKGAGAPAEEPGTWFDAL